MSIQRKVEVECKRYTSTGGRYRVVYQGRTLVDSIRTPAFSACRALLAKGITGTVAMYDLGGATPRLYVDIEKGARLTVEEGEKVSLRLVRFTEFSAGEEEREAA